jgi:hypothetical protein
VSPQLLYKAARIYALCGGDNDLRAFELIQQALGAMPTDQRPAFWSKYIRTDAALQTVRRNPQYQRLDADLSPRK